MSPDEVYAEAPYMSIRFDSRRNCVLAEFKGFATSVEFRAGTMKILDAIGEHGVDSLISDNRHLEVVTEADQMWIRDAWVPLAVAAGLKRIGVVLAKQGLGKFASQEIISQFPDSTFVTRTFDSLDEAKKWLASEKPR